VQLTFLNFNYKKKYLNIFECQQVTVRIPPAVCVPQFESSARASGATGPAMRHDVAEDLNAERHHRENLKSCTYVHVGLETANRRIGKI